VPQITAVIAWSAFAVLVSFGPASAEKRVALVIGNGAYQKVSKLLNPTNDAKAIAGMLQAAIFDEVALHENLGIRELRQAIKDFSDLARDADSAVVYYSGHGIEVNGVNYIIPIDAVLDRDIDVPYEAYSLENLVQVLEPARRLRLVMLDACRDNPFTRTMKRTVGSRAVGRGLAPVEPTSVNTLIGFAAKAGSIALDGEGANSPYAIALLNNLATPGLDLRIAFGRVRDEVLKVTRNRQEPFVYGSLGGGNVSIVDASAPSGPETMSPALAPTTSIDRAAQAWAATKDTTSVAILEDFIKHFGSTVYGSMARARLAELNKSRVAALPAPMPKSSVPAQEKKPQDFKCPNITGVWNSWASGFFGKRDARFESDGTAVYHFGIRGRWWCDKGQLRIEWSDGKPGAVWLSPDGKKILNAEGGVHMSRD
jgi:uncharacterized caspase-like protein